MLPQTPGQDKDHPGRLSVLVADDNKDAADALALLVASWGYQVQVVYDGLAALASARAHPPDMALLDLGLPGMDGYQVALHLRRQPELKYLKLIAVTGFEWTDARLRSEEYGFDQHLLKPVDPGRLKVLLSELTSALVAEADRNLPGPTT